MAPEEEGRAEAPPTLSQRLRSELNLKHEEVDLLETIGGAAFHIERAQGILTSKGHFEAGSLTVKILDTALRELEFLAYSGDTETAEA